MKSFYFHMTEKMYEDIFEKKMPAVFFEGLKSVGNGFKIDVLEGSEEEEAIKTILERYGCACDEEVDEEI